MDLIFVIAYGMINDNKINNFKALNYIEEPQIGFRSNSKLKFDNNYYYGSRPKIELLQRLQIIDTWGSIRANIPNYLWLY